MVLRAAKVSQKAQRGRHFRYTQREIGHTYPIPDDQYHGTNIQESSHAIRQAYFHIHILQLC